jgi:hypothetical protein
MRIVFFDLSVLCWLLYRQRHKRAFLFKATTRAVDVLQQQDNPMQAMIKR